MAFPIQKPKDCANTSLPVYFSYALNIDIRDRLLAIAEEVSVERLIDMAQFLRFIENRV